MMAILLNVKVSDEGVEAESYNNVPVSRDYMRRKYTRTYTLLLLHYKNLKD